MALKTDGIKARGAAESPLIIALTKYAQRGASSRVRFKNLFPELTSRGWQLRHIPLLDDDTLAEFYRRRRHDYRRIARSYGRFFSSILRAPRPAAWWVEKELLPGLPSVLEMLLLPILPRAIIDYDDAVYLDFKDEARGPFGRAHKFRRYARRAAHITVGSEALREQFEAWGARRVTKIPSTVDVKRYPVREHRMQPAVTIGWIGTPMTVPFLEPMKEILPGIARHVPIRVHVIGATWQCPGVDVHSSAWSEATESAAVAEFDVGIMPLVDGPWERGKCGYKLIQYMAAGVVPVGSRVGENPRIIDEGTNGCLASSPSEWREKLERLVRDIELRRRLGAAARAKAWAEYDVGCAARAVDSVFSQMAPK